MRNETSGTSDSWSHVIDAELNKLSGKNREALLAVFFEGLTGPRRWNVDTSVSKFFHYKERYSMELRLDSFNTTNTFIPSDPSTDVTSSSFGTSTWQANVGRTVQYTMRLQF